VEWLIPYVLKTIFRASKNEGKAVDRSAELATSRDPSVAAVRLEVITKRFENLVANDNVTLNFMRGEVHALLGENGAGKTTLMNVLYGLYKQDSGEIYRNGVKVRIESPKHAISYGIGMIHQHFMLVPTLTVVENIILGLDSENKITLDLGKASEEIKAISEKYNLPINPKAMVWQLSVGEQQRVEIIKALYRGAEVLILDEPTAVLTPQEAEKLFEVLRSMKEEGRTVIFISHKLDEVTSVSDNITILRRGKVIATLPASKCTKEELAKLMVGREITFQMQNIQIPAGQVVLRVENLHALSNRGQKALRGVSLEVRGGEILGVAGVAGNGQSELAEAIYGMRETTQGRVIINGEVVNGKGIPYVLEHGVGYIPEDRVKVGLVLNLSVAENFVLQSYSKKPFSSRGLLNLKSIEGYAKKLVDEFDVKTPNVFVPTKQLSGGNLQKLLLARELARAPRLLLAVQPTRGLDIGATQYIRQRLLEQKSRGSAILLISEDLEELFLLSDRIAVMYDGQILDIMNREEADKQKVGLLMAGIKN
jgi:simple sugar transport system ATP-binding protein